MRVIKGNLLDAAEGGQVDVIMHGCNCFNAMGSGIAGEIASRYPNVPQADRDYGVYSDPALLGDYSVAEVKQRVRRARVDTTETLKHPFTVINLYTQFRPGPDFIPTVFPIGLQRVASAYEGHTIGIPMIGCGIGGGDWGYVMNCLLDVEPKVTWKVYVL